MTEFKELAPADWKKIWSEIDYKEYAAVEQKFQEEMKRRHGPGSYYMDDDQYWELKMLLIQQVVDKWIKKKNT